jgi:hypothetical protein
MSVRPEAVIGCLLGTAVGDALGLPYENLSRRRQLRLCRDPGRYHFLFGRGMASDDTEHACLTAQALITSAGDIPGFRRDLGRRLRWWFAGLPGLSGLWEWPRSVAWMERLGERLGEVSASGTPQRALPLAVWAVPLRNLLFLAVVLAHGFRRLLPPY